MKSEYGYEFIGNSIPLIQLLLTQITYKYKSLKSSSDKNQNKFFFDCKFVLREELIKAVTSHVVTRNEINNLLVMILRCVFKNFVLHYLFFMIICISQFLYSSSLFLNISIFLIKIYFLDIFRKTQRPIQTNTKAIIGKIKRQSIFKYFCYTNVIS